MTPLAEGSGASSFDPWHRVGDFLQIGSLCDEHGFAALASHWCPCDDVTLVYEWVPETPLEQWGRKRQARRFRQEVLRAACPYCGASAGEPCRSRSGARTMTHSGRVDAYRAHSEVPGVAGAGEV